ncbi:hypothetical protein PFISCL1PPCAC_4574, partial [Pristionchus fissidentatus]
DEWDYLEEVNVMEMWPADQRKNVTSTKWAERKDALQALLELIEKNPRLFAKSTTVYGEIIDELKKILLKDSNVNVVAVAIKVVGALARGLRRHFGGFVGMIWTPLLEKAKDKKAGVKEALPSCLDAVAATCTLDRISGPLAEQMMKPSSDSKLMLDAFIYRILLTLPNAQAGLPFIKEITPLLVKHASDADTNVRDGACAALGGVRRLMGSAMDGMMGTLTQETPKMGKITAACEKATAEAAELEEARRLASGGERREGGETSAAGGSDESGEGGAAASGSAAAAANLDPWTLLDAVELEAVMDKNFTTQLAQKKWQDRKEALEGLEKVLVEKKRLQPSAELGSIVAMINKVLEKDVNITVTAAAAACLSLMAAALRADFAAYAPKMIAVCFDKFKEKKTAVREKVIECVDAAANTVSIESFTEEILAGLAKPNPACRSQTALFVSRLLSQHTMATLPRDAAKAVAGGLVKLSSDPDSECRDSSFSALASLLRCVGEAVGRNLMGEVADDKIRMAKIEKLRDDLVTEKGVAKASEEMKRLHGEGMKSQAAPSRPAAYSSNGGAAAAAGRKQTTVSMRPAAAGVRPATSSAARKPPTSTPIRVAASRPSTAAAAAAPRQSSMSRRSPPLSARPTRSNSNVRGIGSGRSTPIHGSRENLASGPLTLDGARFIGDETGKEARLAENRPSSLSDFLRLSSLVSSPPLIALLRAEDAVGIQMTIKFFEAQSPSILSAHSDILTRWLSLRLSATSTPPTLLQRLIPAAAKLMGDCGFLSDQELSMLVPAAMTKVGDTREVIRSDARSLIFSLVESMGAKTVLPYLLEGLKSKIIRQKMDTLSIISSLLSKDSTLLASSTVVTIKKLIPLLLDCLADRDALTRTAALNACVGVESQLREREEWKTAIAKLPAKEKAMLVDRLAKAANGTAPAPRQLAPMPRPTVTTGGGATAPAAAAAIRPIGLPRPTPSVLPGSRLPRPGSGFVKK